LDYRMNKVMRIIIELEDGDRFMMRILLSQTLKSIFTQIKESQYLDPDTEFVMFTAPPLQIIKDES